MEFKRYFTKTGIHPYEEVNWITTTSQINGKNGEVIFKQENVEFPDFWDQIAIDITVEKYFAGALGSKNREYSLKQLINRIVDWYVEKGKNDKYFDSETDRVAFRMELTYLLLHQYGMFNSPVLFNVGIQKEPQVSACYIVSADDTMDSISKNMKVEMDIFRRGSGAGSNRSGLRSSKESVSTGGTAMGPLLPIQIYDKIAKATKSGGKTRRSAKMEILNIDHGDIENFIIQKAEIEKAAKILIKEGWNSDFDDPKGAYGILGLQNFNESVSVFDSFMKAVEKDEDWALIERKEISNWKKDKEVDIKGKITSQGWFFLYEKEWFKLKEKDENKAHRVIKWVKAKDLWNLICESAWECADPGLQFYDTINEWHTCKKDGDIKGSNPCSEYLFLDDTSCNLASLNLLKFLKEDDKFDINGYIQAIKIFITAMDISVHNASYPTEKITKKTIQYRTLGLGYTNLGALLLSKSMPYDSNEGRGYASALTTLLLAAAYNTSACLGNDLGSFERFEENKENMFKVLDKHREAIKNLYNEDIEHTETAYILETAQTLFPLNIGNFRNAQVVVLAPTGTISFMMGAETTGIEPVLGLVTYKKMVGGGYFKLTTPSMEKALEKLGYSKNEINNIEIVIDNNLEELKNYVNDYHLPIFQTSFGSENILSPEAHLKMMAAVQPFVSGAISKTINLPNSATVEDISNIYLQAWKLGLKSVSVYRDNCKGSQPLNIQKEDRKKEDRKKEETNNNKIARKVLPDDRPGHIHKFQVGGQKGFLQFGFYPDSGKLGEMYAEISKGGSTLNGLMNTIAILISHMLQYGIPPQEIIDALKNLQFEPSGFTNNSSIKTASSIPDYIAKYIESLIEVKSEKSIIKEVIEESIENNTELIGPPCRICGYMTVKTGTCYSCPNCGDHSGCG